MSLTAWHLGVAAVSQITRSGRVDSRIDHYYSRSMRDSTRA